jgi:hypothetical protein
VVRSRRGAHVTFTPRIRVIYKCLRKTQEAVSAFAFYSEAAVRAAMCAIIRSTPGSSILRHELAPSRGCWLIESAVPHAMRRASRALRASRKSIDMDLDPETVKLSGVAPSTFLEERFAPCSMRRRTNAW